MEQTTLHERLRMVVGEQTYRTLAELSGHHAETVRRYMSGQSPSTEFLATVCREFDVNAGWLLTGQGPMRHSEAIAQALRQAPPGELLRAIAGSVERLSERVERVEARLDRLDAELSGGARGTPHKRRGRVEYEEFPNGPAAARGDGFADGSDFLDEPSDPGDPDDER